MKLFYLCWLIPIAILFGSVDYAVHNYKARTYNRFLYVEYLDGQKSHYSLKDCYVDLLPHLNMIKINVKTTNDTATIYIPMHNLRFFGMSEEN